jgi:hypothetical protein
MRRVDQLITQVRSETDNTDYGAAYGIQQEEFRQYLDEAQTDLQASILIACPMCTWFNKETILSLVSYQKDYAIPTDSYYRNNIKKVEFSLNGIDFYYTPLWRSYVDQLSNWWTWPPNSYACVDTNVRLSPPPISGVGTIRMTYVRRLPNLDIPRGTITSYTPATKALLLANDSFLDATALGLAANVPGYLSVTNINGSGIAYSVYATTYTSGTRTLTLSADPTYEGAYAISDMATSYVTLGKFSTPISQLAEETERFLVCYCAWKIFKRDASMEANDMQVELENVRKNILAGLSAPATDAHTIPMEFGIGR